LPGQQRAQTAGVAIDELVCLTVYRGTREVVRRLDGGERMAA
jgi:hypothetical protein